MTAAEKRRLLPLLRAVYGRKKITHSHVSAAEFLLHRLGKSSGKGKRAQRERTATGKAAQRVEDAALRAAVFQRAGGICELGTGPTEDATELHHLEGGSGRTALQRVENCMAACFYCHRDYHNHPEDFRPVVLAWCAKYSYPVPRRFRRPAPTAVAEADPPSGTAAAVARGLCDCPLVDGQAIRHLCGRTA